MDVNGPALSVIVPIHNEAPIISDTIGILTGKLDDCGENYEVILVDDGSTDGTLQIIRRHESMRVKLLHDQKNYGKGYAVKRGMIAARGAYRIFIDADLSTSLQAFDEFLGVAREGTCDILIGSRKRDHAAIKIRQPPVRIFLGKGFMGLSRIVTGLDFSDFTCGFKLFTQRAAEIIFPRQTVRDWAFDTELLLIAQLHDLKVGEIPVTWRHRYQSRVRLIKDILSCAWSLFKIRMNLVRGVYR